jgi:hypothetical protein
VRFAASIVLALVAIACTSDAAATTAAWDVARRDWEETRNPAAYGEWLAIDERFPEGRESHRRIHEADQLYRLGISRVAAGDASAREPFEQAVHLAPMDPRLYLPLARAFRAEAELAPDNPHLFIRAAEYYRKFITLAPDDPDHAIALLELEELDPESDLAALDAPAHAPAQASPSVLGGSLGVAVVLSIVALVLALAALAVILARPSGLSLPELADKRPELHPAIAYLVSSLRHELLKHRIGAVSSGIDAIAQGRASSPQREFVSTRLFGGEPLGIAWEGHLRAFERALGPELDLRRRDRAFRRAGAAITTIGKLEVPLSRGEATASRRLREAHAELRLLDRDLAALVSRMVRTRVDEALVADTLDDVRKEYAASRIALGPVPIEAPTPAPEIEVFRIDLVLVLKNVLRNAILAVGRMEPTGSVKIEIAVELEATGEENVVIRVLDTSKETLTTEAIYERRVDRGLGLVTAALTRYDGAIVVEPAEPPWAKAVTLRFFRAYGDREEE